jgi:hypothetical protein
MSPLLIGSAHDHMQMIAQWTQSTLNLRLPRSDSVYPCISPNEYWGACKATCDPAVHLIWIQEGLADWVWIDSNGSHRCSPRLVVKDKDEFWSDVRFELNRRLSGERHI